MVSKSGNRVKLVFQFVVLFKVCLNHFDQLTEQGFIFDGNEFFRVFRFVFDYLHDIEVDGILVILAGVLALLAMTAAPFRPYRPCRRKYRLQRCSASAAAASGVAAPVATEANICTVT